MTKLEKFLDETLFAIVVYRTELLDSESFASMYSLLEKSGNAADFFVYDNSPNPQVLPDRPYSRFHYMNDPSNPGVSKAYNEAANCALSLSGKKFVLIMDQDTEFREGALEAYAEGSTYSKLVAPTLMLNQRIYSPCKYGLKIARHFKEKKIGLHPLKGANFLNSGLLISLDIFKAVGGYREDIPMYFSDFDFIERLSQKQTSFYWSEADCFHQLSDVVDKDKGNAQRRYKLFCKGARNMSKGALDFILLFFVCTKRALRLSLDYKSLEFFMILWTYYICNA